MPMIKRVIKNPKVISHKIIASPGMQIRQMPICSNRIIARRPILPTVYIGNSTMHIGATLAILAVCFIAAGVLFSLSHLVLSLLATTLLVTNAIALNNTRNSSNKQQQTVGLSATAILAGISVLGFSAACLMSLNTIFLPLAPVFLVNIPVAMFSIGFGSYCLANNQISDDNSNVANDGKSNDGKHTQVQQNPDHPNKSEQKRDENNETAMPSSTIQNANSATSNPKDKQNQKMAVVG